VSLGYVFLLLNLIVFLFLSCCYLVAGFCFSLFWCVWYVRQIEQRLKGVVGHGLRCVRLGRT